MGKLLILCLSFSILSFALPIDSQLTIKILETTKSGKTIFLNRGSADGLNVGDHAKLFVTEAIVARAVLIKNNTQTSIWSVYRMVNPDLVINDAVLKLKITPEVKLSKNPYSMLARESITGLNVLSGSGDDYSVYSDLLDDRDYSKTVGEEIVSKDAIRSPRLERNFKKRFLEIWSHIGFHYFTSEVSSGDNFSGTEFFSRISGGLEIYIGRWFSLAPQFTYMQDSVLTFDGSVTDSILYEYGGALNIYPFTSPHDAYKLIPYLHGGAAIGSIVDSLAPGTLGGATSTSSTTTDASGTSFAYFAGLGLKYHFKSKLGVRMLLDVYRRLDTFSDLPASVGMAEWERARIGPRISFGFSYRF